MKESDDSGPAAEKSAAKPVIEPDTPPPTKAEPVKPLANLNDAFKTRQVIVNPSPEISKQTTPKLQEWNRQAPFQRFESIEPLSSSKLYQGRQ